MRERNLGRIRAKTPAKANVAHVSQSLSSHPQDDSGPIQRIASNAWEITKIDTTSSLQSGKHLKCVSDRRCR